MKENFLKKPWSYRKILNKEYDGVALSYRTMEILMRDQDLDQNWSSLGDNADVTGPVKNLTPDAYVGARNQVTEIWWRQFVCLAEGNPVNKDLGATTWGAYPRKTQGWEPGRKNDDKRQKQDRVCTTQGHCQWPRTVSISVRGRWWGWNLHRHGFANFHLLFQQSERQIAPFNWTYSW